MKKTLLLTVCATLMLTGCGTYAGAGAYTGSSIGSVLGSAIGGISGGWHGHEVGQIVGMAGGAIIGGAIGNAADNKAKREVQQHYDRVQQQKAMDYPEFDSSNSGDDRLYDFDGSDYTGHYSAVAPSQLPTSAYDSRGNAAIEIRNARFVDDNQDNQLNSNEVCKVIFEVVNQSDQVLYDIQPTVQETTGNKHIYISQSIHVERLAPRQGIRYTAMVKADKRLKNGTACFNLSVLQGGNLVSPVTEFAIPTKAGR